jgi:hypothetical protein
MACGEILKPRMDTDEHSAAEPLWEKKIKERSRQGAKSQKPEDGTQLKPQIKTASAFAKQLMKRPLDKLLQKSEETDG